MLNRILKFMHKPSSERSTQIKRKLRQFLLLPFALGCSYLRNIYIAYMPDSYATFGNTTVFDNLFKSFIKKNKLKNSGDIPRLWSFILNVQKIMDENIEGDFAELGVWRGNTASILAKFALDNNRKVYLFDTFDGFDQSDLKGIDTNKKVLFQNTSIRLVSAIIGNASEVCEFVVGKFPSSIKNKHKQIKYSIVSLDCDLYAPMKAGLQFFYPLMPKGSLFLLHDYSSLWWEGTKKAVDEFCQETGEHVILLPDKSGSALLRKSLRDY